MKAKIFAVLAITLLSFQSCNVDACINKGYFLSTYNNFMKDFDKHHETYSSQDWESKDEKIKNFVDDCYPVYESDMTGEEKVKFWKKYVKYMFVRHTSGALKAIEAADQDSPTAIFDEILDSLEDADIEELFKDVVGDDIGKAVDEVLNEVNKWGDQIKDWLKSRN